MSLYIFSVLVRCLNLSHVTTLRVLSKFYCWNLLDHIDCTCCIHFILFESSFLFILNIFPFYYGNSKWNTCFRSENLKCATPFKKLTKQFSDADHLIFSLCKNIKIVLMNNLCKFNLSFSLENQCKYKYYVLSRVFFTFLSFLFFLD